MFNSKLTANMKLFIMSLFGLVIISMVHTKQSYDKQLELSMKNLNFVNQFKASNAETDALLIAKLSPYSTCNNKPASQCNTVSRSKAVTVSMNYDIETIIKDENLSLFAPKAVPFDEATKKAVASKLVYNNKVGYDNMVCSNGVCKQTASQGFAFAFNQKGYSDKMQTELTQRMREKREQRRLAFERENSGSYAVEKLYGKLPKKPLKQI